MDAEAARLFFEAARSNPFLAAWISVLDAYALPATAPVAPYDWWDAFQELFHHDLLTADQLNATHVKHEFFRRHPPQKDIDRALAALHARRAERSPMPEKPFSFVESPLSRSSTEPNALVRSDRDSALGSLASRTAAARPPDLAHILEPVPSTAAQRGDLGVLGRAPLPRTAREPAPFDALRRGLERRSPARDQHMPPAGDVDPRSYVEEFHPKLFCCGRELTLELEGGEELGDDENRDVTLVEIIFRSECPSCHVEGHHSFMRPMPKAPR